MFLVVTGSEALYAKLGHFERAPIRRTWLFLVWPALMLNYLGQGALLLTVSGHPGNSSFALVPQHALPGLLLLATLATIIASQAIISGVLLLIMLTWHWGQERVQRRNRQASPMLADFLAGDALEQAERVPGTAIFLSSTRVWCHGASSTISATITSCTAQPTYCASTWRTLRAFRWRRN